MGIILGILIHTFLGVNCVNIRQGGDVALGGLGVVTSILDVVYAERDVTDTVTFESLIGSEKGQVLRIACGTYHLCLLKDKETCVLTIERKYKQEATVTCRMDLEEHGKITKFVSNVDNYIVIASGWGENYTYQIYGYTFGSYGGNHTPRCRGHSGFKFWCDHGNWRDAK